MDLLIKPSKLTGRISVIPSKSQAHRLMICSAFADKPTFLHCSDTNRDIEATAACLSAMGAQIQRTSEGYQILPIKKSVKTAWLPCGDSGSTLRFLLPVVGALGIDATFKLEGKLPQRPLSPLWEEMERMGCKLKLDGNCLHCSGQLCSGEYSIDGGVSSQFVSGLLFAAALIPGENAITITGKTESKPYIDMTLDVLKTFGCNVEDFRVTGGKSLCSPRELTVEGDWSNGAFFLAANTLGNDLTVENLSDITLQGDSAVAALLIRLKQHCVISGAHIPDLIPILSVIAACNQGAVFTNIGRLRLKESDRVEAIISMIHGLGGNAEVKDDTITVYGTGLTGGSVDCANDHRIAMSAAIAATACKNPVILYGAECIQKSYPHFFEEYHRLGGHYEQYIR